MRKSDAVSLELKSFLSLFVLVTIRNLRATTHVPRKNRQGSMQSRRVSLVLLVDGRFRPAHVLFRRFRIGLEHRPRGRLVRRKRLGDPNRGLSVLGVGRLAHGGRTGSQKRSE